MNSGGGRVIILHIWHGVSWSAVAAHSYQLADIVAVSTRVGAYVIADSAPRLGLPTTATALDASLVILGLVTCRGPCRPSAVTSSKPKSLGSRLTAAGIFTSDLRSTAAAANRPTSSWSPRQSSCARRQRGRWPHPIRPRRSCGSSARWWRGIPVVMLDAGGGCYQVAGSRVFSERIRTPWRAGALMPGRPIVLAPFGGLGTEE